MNKKEKSRENVLTKLIYDFIKHQGKELCFSDEELLLGIESRTDGSSLLIVYDMDFRAMNEYIIKQPYDKRI